MLWILATGPHYFTPFYYGSVILVTRQRAFTAAFCHFFSENIILNAYRYSKGVLKCSSIHFHLLVETMHSHDGGWKLTFDSLTVTVIINIPNRRIFSFFWVLFTKMHHLEKSSAVSIWGTCVLWWGVQHVSDVRVSDVCFCDKVNSTGAKTDFYLQQTQGPCSLGTRFPSCVSRGKV